jgi:hypothetical protein
MPSYPMSPQVVVEVTQEAIADGIMRDSSHCMIAEAVKVAFPGATRVSVDLQTIRFTDPQKRLRYTYLTPRVAQIHLIEMDQGRREHIIPFRFRLRKGQVTAAGQRYRQATDHTRDQTQAARDASLLNRQRLVRRATDANGPAVPDVVGGRTPPTTPFARRRAFGLRALER